MEIHEVLKFSYDGLDRSQKDIFLDIACFFKGRDKDWVTGVLKAFDFFPASGIQVLLDKALITISNSNWIEMHDLIQEMGREIVHRESKDPGRRTRLWRHEEVIDVLKYNKGTDVVEGILLDSSKLTEDLYLSSDSLAKMTNMRFLSIYGMYSRYTFDVYLPNGLESMSDKLRYLHWDECYLESFPPNVCAEKLVQLRMQLSKLKKLWDGIQNLVNLKDIDLAYSRDLIKIPDLSKAEKLESVSLSCCESLRQLHAHSKSLHELRLNGRSSLKEFSVASEEMILLNLSKTTIFALSLSTLSLPKLTYLDLSGFKDIESLDVHLKSLRELNLFDCSSLKEFSVASEEMTKLNLSRTAICVLSLSTLCLPKLTYLDLSGCKDIESLNVHLKSLYQLNLFGCSSLKEFSVTTEKMKELNLSSTGICELSFNWLSLEQLNLHGTNVKSLPAYIKNLSMLTKLRLDGCKKLMSLSELPPSLEEPYLDDCWRLMSFPELPPSLTWLTLNGCRKLMPLSKLPPSLEVLYLNDCSKLVSLPKLPPSLRVLNLYDCSKLVSLPKLPPSLRVLNLNDCSKLLSLPKLPPSLSVLALNDCMKLVPLPELPPSLPRLEANN